MSAVLFISLVSLQCWIANGQSLLDSVEANLTCGSTISGFTPSTETKLYGLTLDTDQYVSISSCGSSFDTILNLTTVNGDHLNFNDDSEYCYRPAVIETETALTADTYIIHIAGFNDISFGKYALEIFCDNNAAPVIPEVEGVATDKYPCNFIDFADGFIVPIGSCHMLSKVPTRYTCNDDGNIMYQEYGQFDALCTGDGTPQEYISYQKYAYNCNETTQVGCAGVDMTLDCGIMSLLKFVTDECSSVNSKVYCDGTDVNDGALTQVYYEDDACTEEDYTINVATYDFVPDGFTCDMSWKCKLADREITPSPTEPDYAMPMRKYIRYNVVVIMVVFICYF